MQASATAVQQWIDQHLQRPAEPQADAEAAARDLLQVTNPSHLHGPTSTVQRVSSSNRYGALLLIALAVTLRGCSRALSPVTANTVNKATRKRLIQTHCSAS